MKTRWNPWPNNILLRLGALLWSSPCGILGFIGLMLWLLVTRTNIKFHIRDGSIDIVGNGKWPKKKKDQGWAATTYGWAVIYYEDDSYDNEEIRIHERIHIKQVLKYGIIFPILYLLYHKLYTYKKNPFEIEAYTKASEIYDKLMTGV